MGSPSKAEAVILAGLVKVFDDVSGHEVSGPSLKPGSKFFENLMIEVKDLPRFVSRGGDKLQGALDHWKIQVSKKIALDVGASTGGFTDCLLQNGAVKVYAVDVGHGQMHPKVQNDPRVELFEGAHILEWEPPWKKEEQPSLAVIDVSFISLKNVLKRTAELIQGTEGAQILALVKPQFEVEQKLLTKGIVRSEEARADAVQKNLEWASSIGLRILGHFPCPVKGTKGNQEEWIHLAEEKT